MPWCDPCGRFYNPNTLRVDGTCPNCDTKLAEPPDPNDRQKVPWHFWLLLGALSIYLGWRFIQMVVLVVT